MMNLGYNPIYPSHRSAVFADDIVSTSHPLAAQAGLSILAQGGNAVDAALATAAALTVVEPTGNGLGSDAFAILWDGQELHGLNSSGAAPAAWTPNRFSGLDQMPFRGWESVTVPGAVKAWAELSRRFGKLEFEQLLMPAIKYAEDGFIVSPIIASLWQRGADMLKQQPGFSDAFMPDGRAPVAGERFKNPALARSLRLIAQTKGDAFYTGELAVRMAAFAKQHEAALTVNDLGTHQPEWCGTIQQSFDGFELHEIPPNGQGIAALMALGILHHTPLREMPVDDADAYHLQIEAMKLATSDLHKYVADQRFMTAVTPEALLDPDYLKSRAGQIDIKSARHQAAGVPKHGGTVYLTTADRSGMMVSFIQSNYSGFGSGVVVPETGISLQNRGAGFTLQEGHPNRVGPGKRPFHTIIPGFLTRSGKPQMSFGVMGGPMQAQGHLQMALRTQLWGQSVQTAADAPRWRITQGLEVACEPTLPQDVLQDLADRGHEIKLETPDSAFGFGGAQLIHRLPGGGYVAGSDPRKDGQAVGV
jgi:gamma-glutamyltranspeptidase/glutathione hydrolase